VNKITFEEGEFADLQSVALKLFYEADDPRSPAYQRVLHRPRIPWPAMLACVLLPVFICITAWIVLAVCGIGGFWWIPVLLLLVYEFFQLRRGIMLAILLYQRFAPAKLRCKCRFEPSCSQYALQAIDKYGLRQGIHLMLKRFRRCKPGDGGFDPLP